MRSKGSDKMTEVKNECTACKDKFIWNDEVILVNNELYHKDCLTLYPTGFVAFLDGEFLGETENDDGSSACGYIPELLDED